MEYWEIISLFAGLIIILVASQQLSLLFKKIHLPVVTGLLVIGIISGPHILGLIPAEAIKKFGFINEVSLAFIAFAAGAELYLKEYRSQLKSIRWITICSISITFLLSSIAIFLLSNMIPFLSNFGITTRLGISLLAGTIFVARSPSSAIAVINELRAKGPFTRTIMGVTVLIDVLVIILFAIIISIVNTLISDTSFNIKYVLILVLELFASFFMGWLLGKVLQSILSRKQSRTIKSFLILLSGLGIYLLSNFLRHAGNLYFEVDFYTEPLLICIIASFYVTNLTRYRREFLKIIHDTIPYIYVAFFTLIGASISLDYLAKAWIVGLVFFIIRLVAISIGAFTGGFIAGDPLRYTKISWMSFVTQAGVSIGLVYVVAGEFPEWGAEFATLMIAIIFINQLVGPPMLKWAIGIAGEDHSRARSDLPTGSHRAIIFGYEAQAMALARQLANHGWEVKIATSIKGISEPGIENISIEYCPEINYETLENLEAGKVEAIIALKTDDKNLKICELAYENYGTHDLVVRLNNRYNFSKFHDLGVKIIEPSTAMVSLLDHFVRSPMATSLLLGMEKNQDTVEIVVQNRNLHGIALRDLHLPADILILSTQRRGQMIISTGFTRLRLGDILTLVGSVESIEEIRLRFE